MQQPVQQPSQQSSQQPLTIVILAGQRSGETDLVAVAAGVPCKALAPVAGQAMIDRVLAAVTMRDDNKILVVMPETAGLARYAPQLAAALAGSRALRLDPQASPAQSALAALAHAGPDAPLLLTTADHALLTDPLVRSFLAGCGNAEGAAGVLPLAMLSARYPELRRTRLRFSDGGFKGCNLFYFATPAAARPVLALWRQLEADRKQPWRMARRLGIVTLTRYLLGRLSLAQAFARLSRSTGIKLQPVLLAAPEAALDVDTVADWHFIDRIARQEQA